ncbi:hypothetical protein SDC9_48728 [bioreactor metagenome]|uniref:Uncharacterized protein n=1 Tax=bioreactor metagenome TaxID=1076179 RepID=A0A644WFU5_9ZZZZ
MDIKQNYDARLAIYYFVLGINMLLDKGETENLQKVITECEKGNIYDYINNKYNPPFWKYITVDRFLINKLFKNCGIDIGNSERKFGIYNNGLLYLTSVGTWWLLDGFEYLLYD